MINQASYFTRDITNAIAAACFLFVVPAACATETDSLETRAVGSIVSVFSEFSTVEKLLSDLRLSDVYISDREVPIPDRCMIGDELRISNGLSGNAIIDSPNGEVNYGRVSLVVSSSFACTNGTYEVSMANGRADLVLSQHICIKSSDLYTYNTSFSNGSFGTDWLYSPMIVLIPSNNHWARMALGFNYPRSARKERKDLEDVCITSVTASFGNAR